MSAENFSEYGEMAVCGSIGAVESRNNFKKTVIIRGIDNEGRDNIDEIIRMIREDNPESEILVSKLDKKEIEEIKSKIDDFDEEKTVRINGNDEEIGIIISMLGLHKKENNYQDSIGNGSTDFPTETRNIPEALDGYYLNDPYFSKIGDDRFKLPPKNGYLKSLNKLQKRTTNITRTHKKIF